MTCAYIHGTLDPKTFHIAIPPAAFDERLPFIQSVCDVLVESRFGPGRSSPVVITLSQQPEFARTIFFDNSDGELVPCYQLSPQGRCGYQVIEAEYRKYQRAQQLLALEDNTATLLPRGRGSP